MNVGDDPCVVPLIKLPCSRLGSFYYLIIKLITEYIYVIIS